MYIIKIRLIQVAHLSRNNFHYKDKTISPPSYLYNGNPQIVEPGGCFTNVSRALQNNLAKIYSARNHIYGEKFKPKLCTCAQSMALGTRTKFRLEILIRSTISVMQKEYFGELGNR